jgi:hypothetical protein
MRSFEGGMEPGYDNADASFHTNQPTIGRSVSQCSKGYAYLGFVRTENLGGAAG